MQEPQEKLKRAGLKLTPQRLAIMTYLSATKTHPSADMVHKAIRPDYPGLSLDTVNRTLQTFAAHKLVHVLPGDGDPRRYDADLKDHHHFRCIHCGRVFDTFDPHLNGIVDPSDLDGFVILSRSVTFRGYCSDCSAKEENQSK